MDVNLAVSQVLRVRPKKKSILQLEWRTWPLSFEHFQKSPVVFASDCGQRSRNKHDVKFRVGGDLNNCQYKLILRLLLNPNLCTRGAEGMPPSPAHICWTAQLHCVVDTLLDNNFFIQSFTKWSVAEDRIFKSPYFGQGARTGQFTEEQGALAGEPVLPLCKTCYF